MLPLQLGLLWDRLILEHGIPVLRIHLSDVLKSVLEYRRASIEVEPFVQRISHPYPCLELTSVYGVYEYRLAEGS